MTQATSEAVRSGASGRPLVPPLDSEPYDHLDAEHAENPFLQHHYDTPLHQFEAGKLGIWIFLVTEVLFFSGLFCAYSIYRAQHPEVFQFAHYYLDTNLGALNTVVLLFSSLTAAWAVRAAQLGQHRLLTLLIGVTVLCAATFLGVKYVEYSHKFHDGLLWGKHFDPKHQVWELESFRSHHPEAARLAERLARVSAASRKPSPKAAAGATGATDQQESPIGTALMQLRPSAKAVAPLVSSGVLPKIPGTATTIGPPPNTHVFFGIYFFMTGLHGVHVVAGILVWLWLFRRSLKNHFGPTYFGPIDYAALYWHLVDVIWIYLFPLLYLIH